MQQQKRRLKRSWKAAIILLVCALVLSLGWLWFDNNVDRSGWVEKDGTVYYRDFHARKVSGWQTIDGSRYYFGDDKALATGWQEIDGETYYFGTDGQMVTGWDDIDGARYFFGESGARVTGWENINGNLYYFDDEMKTGWLDLAGSRYYLGTDGIAATGWQEIDGQDFHFGDDGSMSVGWLITDEASYYLNSDGHPTVGSITLGGETFLFREDYTLFTGWNDTDAGRSYYHENGVQAFGWQELEGKRYYFDDDGFMLTGWFQEGEYLYYFQADGSAATSPTVIDGQTYYFSPKGIHVVLVNALNPVPSYYKMNLVTFVEWKQVSDVCYDALAQMLADCEAAGNEYVFNSAYRTIKDQTEILEYRTKEYMENYDLTYEQARAKALETVAIPGTSEHHLGLAVDLLGSDAIAWLGEHCWEYGFILRYTAEKEAYTGIIDEPWHFRYVGTEVSMDMKDSGLCLEEYLGAAPVKGTYAVSVSEN